MGEFHPWLTTVSFLPSIPRGLLLATCEQNKCERNCACPCSQLHSPLDTLCMEPPKLTSKRATTNVHCHVNKEWPLGVRKSFWYQPQRVSVFSKNIQAQRTPGCILPLHGDCCCNGGGCGVADVGENDCQRIKWQKWWRLFFSERTCFSPEAYDLQTLQVRNWLLLALHTQGT